MPRTLVTVLLVTAMLSMAAVPAYPADELFDSATAAKHLEQGISFLKARNYDAAISEFEESAGISPEAEAFYYLGYAYYLQGRAGNAESRKLARENFEKAYEMDPNFTPTRLSPAIPADTAAPPPPEQPQQPGAEPAKP